MGERQPVAHLGEGLMPVPGGLLLTGPEVALLRRCLLAVEHQVEALRGTPDPELVAVRLEESLSNRTVPAA